MKTGYRLLWHELKTTSLSINKLLECLLEVSKVIHHNHTTYSPSRWILGHYHEDGNFSHKGVWDSISDFNEAQTTEKFFKVIEGKMSSM